MTGTTTIDATRGERVDMTTNGGRIRLGDGPVVHDHLLFQDDAGAWWAYSDGSVLYATERDGILLKVAEATGMSTDLEDLHGRFERAIERVARRRVEDEVLEIFDGNKPPKTGRCPRCGGLGTITKGAGRVTCPTCGGSGVVRTG
jgi:hypothetical protein